MQRILAIWAHPRSLSTALERVFIERGDFAIVHEPFSAVYYLREKQADAVKAEFDPDVIADYKTIRDRLLREAESQPVCFKDMCYHCHKHLLADDAFLSRITNVFLIRDPSRAIPSHFAKNPHVTCDEIGYEKQRDVFQRVWKLTGETPPVVLAKDLQDAPAGTLRALCQRIDLEHHENSLHWAEGQRDEWRHWKEWHSEVAQSSKIESSQTEYSNTTDNHPKLAELARYHRPFFEEMLLHRIKPIA